MAAEEAFPVRRSRGSDLYVSELQRARLLSATFALVGERGYEGVSARSVSERAGVSNRTFYQAFSDREDCFLAAFDHAIGGLEPELRAAWESEREWSARVRVGLAALLETLDREPAVRRLLFVEALAAGPRVLARRARVLQRLAGVLDGSRTGAGSIAGAGSVAGVESVARAESVVARAESVAGLSGDPGWSALTAEGVVGAMFGVIHARLLQADPGPLLGLLKPLMTMIVLPYRGSAAAARELELPAPELPSEVRRHRGALLGRPLGSASPVDYRLTVRTQMALAAVAARPGLNNREVSEMIGLSDQGQISRMMKRLAEHGLVENTQAHTKRLARSWRLTAEGEVVIGAHGGGRDLIESQCATRKGGKLVPAKSGRNEKKISRRSRAAFRMTALTHEVLTAVSNLSEGETNPNNREIAQVAGVKDEGQISRLLRRLEGHGLLENTGGHSAAGNAWRLAPRGEELLSASSRSPRGAGQ
jgi:AcrR family transcriptional regulator/DNA-binding PadR family transcriptional regulator